MFSDVIVLARPGPVPSLSDISSAFSSIRRRSVSMGRRKSPGTTGGRGAAGGGGAAGGSGAPQSSTHPKAAPKLTKLRVKHVANLGSLVIAEAGETDQSDGCFKGGHDDVNTTITLRQADKWWRGTVVLRVATEDAKARLTQRLRMGMSTVSVQFGRQFGGYSRADHPSPSTHLKLTRLAITLIGCAFEAHEAGSRIDWMRI